MQFSFNLPTQIEFGSGNATQVGLLAKEIVGGRKVFLVTDPGIEQTGISGTVQSSLEIAGFQCLLYNEVEANPKDDHCEAGGEEAKRFGAELIVAVGGGSVIDAAKAIALLMKHDRPLREYEGRAKILNGATPLIAIPTTAGTGSEVTRSAVITDRARKFKMTLKDLTLAPRLALVDPDLTFSVPPGLTASTGMDALVHALEAFTCRLVNPFVEMLALRAMELIYPALPQVVRNGQNREAREAMMFGSLLAGLAFSHADVAAVHCMAEAIGGRYDIPHGVGNSIFLPLVTAYNSEADPNRHARAAKACGLHVAGLADQEASIVLVEGLKEMARQIGIPSFSELAEIEPDHFSLLARAAVINGSTPSNCRQITENDYCRLFNEAYYGQNQKGKC